MRERQLPSKNSNSPRHSEARQKEIDVILAFGDLGSKRMPYGWPTKPGR